MILSPIVTTTKSFNLYKKNNSNLPSYKISKPRNLPKLSRSQLISPILSTCSTVSSSSPLYSAQTFPQLSLTKSNLEFLNNNNNLKEFYRNKLHKLNDWLIDNDDYNDDEIDYLNMKYLINSDSKTKQHVENISYVYNIEEFTANLFLLDDELILGDDCEHFYHRTLQQKNQQSFDLASLEFDQSLFEESLNFQFLPINDFDENDFIIENIPILNNNEQIKQKVETFFTF